MKVTVYTLDGREVRIRSMPADDVAALSDEWLGGIEPVLTFALDGDAVTHIARAAIARIDIDGPQ